ncbi:outer membrane efflux protein [Granulicella mallensis MP5ACTX8]|uniref:Outer membrane efflux protein n=2 Tax=Granulicella mallensis TaxID=940614 RepID=G8P0C2_GRAMM|nr:outer membrane efflux protein [Granulicella mallensis MP5ACTX8]
MLLKRTMQIRWSKAMGIGLAMCLCACASAQISLTSAVDLALRNNPKVLAAQASVNKARAALAQAHDAYIPSAGINGGYGGSTGVPLNVPVVFSLSSQSLVFNFSQPDYVRAAASGLQSATFALQDARDQVSEDVVVTYLSLDNAQQRQAAMLQEYGFATRLFRIVQDRLDAGQDSQSEFLGARLTADQIRAAQLQTDDEITALSDHLSRLTGLPERHLTVISSSIPALPPAGSFPENGPDSAGVRAAFASAKSKQETAFGDARYRFRPVLSFDANYSRISTSHTNYPLYYPGFQSDRHLSDNALSAGVQIQIPLFDRGHQDRARESAAEAARARFEAEEQRNQFFEGQLKLHHSIDELQANSKVAEDYRDIAQAKLDAVLVQLSANAGDPNKPQLTPKDEQNARLQERQRFVELLNMQFQLSQAQVNLMRQTGQLEPWLKAAATQPAATSITSPQ